MIKNLADFVSQSKIERHKNLTGVRIFPDRVVATDTFKLIEVMHDTDTDEPFTVILPKGIKTFDIVSHSHIVKGKDNHRIEVLKGDDDIYPDYQKIMPKDEPDLTITISAHHLKTIAEAFITKKGELGEMKIGLYHDRHKPIVFTDPKKTIKALLMQIIH